MLAPGASNVEVLQVFSYGGVLGEGRPGEGRPAGIADCLPGEFAASVGVASLLLQAQVRSAQPVLILSLALQSLHHVPLHLPGDLAWPAPFPDPLPAWNSLPHQSQSQEHPEHGEGTEREHLDFVLITENTTIKEERRN